MNYQENKFIEKARNVAHKRQEGKKTTTGFQKILRVAVVSGEVLLLAIPIVFSAFLLFVRVRIESTIPREVLLYVGSQEITQEHRKIMNDLGFNWLPSYSQIYIHIPEVIALLVIIFIIIGALIVYKETKRKA